MTRFFILEAFVLAIPLLPVSKAVQNCRGQHRKMKMLTAWLKLHCLKAKVLFRKAKSQSANSVVHNIAHGQAFVKLRLRGRFGQARKTNRDCFSKWRVCTALQYSADLVLIVSSCMCKNRKFLEVCHVMTCTQACGLNSRELSRAVQIAKFWVRS